MHFKKSIILLIFFSPLCNLWAQETQVPFCAGVGQITPNMAAQLEEFQQYEGFQYANLFIDGDSVYTIEVYYKPEEIVLRQRRGISERELGNMCQIIFDQDLVEPEEVEIVKSGRTELILSSMSLGLAYYSWAVPATFHAYDDDRFLISSYLLIGGSSFFVPFFATRNREVTAGMGKGYSNGSFMGAWHGVAATGLLMGEDVSNAVFGISTLTSVTEGVLLYKYAQKNNLSYGHMSLIGAGGTWGMFYGLGFPFIGNSYNGRLYAFSTLATSGMGMFLADRYARTTPISEGDVAIISTLGVLGAYMPMALLLSVDQYPPGNLIVATMMSGSAASMAMGLHKARNFDYSIDDGVIIITGTMAGMLTGLGLTFLISPYGTGAGPYLLWSGIGATGGFFLTDHLIRRSSSNRNITSGLQLDFNPMAIYQRQSTKTEWENPYQPRQQPYLFRAAYRF